MTGTVLKFTGTETEYPSDRVADFIALARQVEALIPNDKWERDLWSVGASFRTKGQNRDNCLLAFYDRSTRLTSQHELFGGAPLAQPFKEFAKAYVRYMHSTSPVSYEVTTKRLDALQLIEAGFRSLDLEPRIENLTVSVLNTAVSMAKEGVGPGRHYQFAIGIQQIHRFCLDRKFLFSPFQWKHGVRKPKDKTEEIGTTARKWRDKKLPSPAAFYALAHIYRKSKTFQDRLYSAMTAIFVAIPIRIHEVLQLRDDCETYAKVKNPETGETVDGYGIRVFPGKDNPPQVKWVPTQMASIVQEAVARIREMCAPARAVAAWYEANPGQLYLPEGLERFRHGNWLPIDLVPLLLSGQAVPEAKTWVRKNGVEWRSTNGRGNEMGEVRLSSLGKRLLQDLPRGFPHFNGIEDQKYSETLAVLFVNQVHGLKGDCCTLVEQATIQSFSQWLAGRVDGRKLSVFDEWGYTESDGTQIRLTSHTFRHWLNTVAQLSGMSEIDIALWSGRELNQNKAYDHVTPEETLSQIRAAFDDGSGLGPMFESGKMVGIKRPVDRKEFAEAQIGAALTTELGICVHDYSLLPCQTHGDCLGCSENVFIKGDAKHRERIEKRLVLNQKQLDDALWAMAGDSFGADRWVQSHEASIAKMKEMITIHDNAAIPDGTVVSLRGAALDSEVAMALRDRDALGSTAVVEETDADEAEEILGDICED
ncbi:hypothetical protein [Agrobacterium tumefaciens]|uniref:hypothetical protein n=1 Tax=Agrobacterium tumefaciens TaxID=358 RepID=UPI001576CF86|nr:hypothetical protein [Agrobacterium tumefaciens]NTZ89279.1 hypothetical protein [Agrobacterium tumefaciens]